jgi:Cu2+-exporting ATPase
LAAIAQFAAPPLLPLSAALLLYTTIPTFRGAYDVIVTQRRVGIDFLDAVVVLGCLAALQLFPGALLAWCLAAARSLLRHTEKNSKNLLVGAFGKQPRYVWLIKDSIEIQMSLDRLEKGDIVAVHTGQVVPVDGVIVDGMAMIDQQALTGESTPAEKGVGDRVYASTVMVAGKIHVAVEKSGGETATARIAQILNDSIGHKLALQHKGEQLADKAVLPTLGLGGLAYATLGPAGSVAVINSDLGTGIRMAAPLAMLSTLALCAQKGILVKDGRALDLLCEVDTVLFDKTGTLTRERPEVERVIAANGFAPRQILR